MSKSNAVMVSLGDLRKQIRALSGKVEKSFAMGTHRLYLDGFEFGRKNFAAQLLEWLNDEANNKV